MGRKQAEGGERRENLQEIAAVIHVPRIATNASTALSNQFLRLCWEKFLRLYQLCIAEQPDN